MTVLTIDEVFRDYVTDGVPTSGPFRPLKADIRDTLNARFTQFETVTDAQADGVGQNYIQTTGYSAIGDGPPRIWKKVASQPAHPFRWVDTAGNWYESTAPRKLVASNSQSNGGLKAFVWAAPKNLVKAEASTTLVAVDGTQINAALSFTASLALAHPETDWALYNNAGGGLDISHWIDGLKFKFETATTETMPTSGFVRLNNADPLLATALFGSIFTLTGVRKIFSWATASAGRTITLSKASDPGVFAKYTVTSSSFPDIGGLFFKAVMVYHSHAGTLLASDDIKVIIDPRMYEDRFKPHTLALFTQLGITVRDLIMHWWQIESDVEVGLGMAEFIADHNQLRDTAIADGLILPSTPWVIHGIQSEANAPSRVGYDIANRDVLLPLVKSHGSYTYVHTAELGPAYWGVGTDDLHVNALGGFEAGGMAFECFEHGMGIKELAEASGGAEPFQRVKYTMLDDTVVTFDVPASSTGYLKLATQSQDIWVECHWISSATAPLITAQSEGPGPGALILEQTTGILTGTTGVDGKITQSIHTNNKIYVENRSGSTIGITFYIMGAMEI